MDNSQKINPANTYSVEEKKSRWWIWLIIILVVLGIGFYIWLSPTPSGIPPLPEVP